ncbi:hypothetical protein O0L34_g6337 [Tuta absoluta]|nr:hypothetical protein O0L34_g6337 [Tuta absoluta]
MADTDTETLPNGTGALSEEDERMKQRPADIDADVREMERRKRVEALMSSKMFREELERVLDQQLHEGGDAPLLQRIREMVGNRLHTGRGGPSCVLPINDIRGIEGIGYEKGEKILRCKLAAVYRLVDLFGWTQTAGMAGQITARLNTAVEQVLTTPRGLLPHEVTASSLVKVDMQGSVVDQGTTNFPVNAEGFSVHGAVHAARPDLRCVLHVRSASVLAVSCTRRGLLPLCHEAALLGDIAYHQVPTASLARGAAYCRCATRRLCWGTSPTTRCLLVSDDTASLARGAAYCRCATRRRCWGTSPTTRCLLVSDDTASLARGAAYCRCATRRRCWGTSPTTRCLLVSDDTASLARGAAYCRCATRRRCWGTSPTTRCLLVSDDTASLARGAAYCRCATRRRCWGTSPTTRCLLVSDDTASLARGAAYCRCATRRRCWGTSPTTRCLLVSDDTASLARGAAYCRCATRRRCWGTSPTTRCLLVSDDTASLARGAAYCRCATRRRCWGTSPTTRCLLVSDDTASLARGAAYCRCATRRRCWGTSPTTRCLLVSDDTASLARGAAYCRCATRRRCWGTSPTTSESCTRRGLLPLCHEAALLGDIAYHQVPTGVLDNEEQEKLVRALGPHSKVLVLASAGALCCGSTLEEAFYAARNLTAAADVQLRLNSSPVDDLYLLSDATRKQIYEASRKPPNDQAKWRVGGEEFEALMRMLDNAGFRTGYIYRHPLIKNDVPKPKNDVEVPPAVSSLGYLLEEEELYRQGLWKKGLSGMSERERTRWLNSPNVYQKVEVLETGTNDPRKITKWVDANTGEWVQDGSPAHSSTPVKIDTLQFVPKNTNPKEFKALQQQIKENRRADKISAGPQSHILEGVTWDEAAKLAEDAQATHTGDHVVLMGAASKGIIQRGYQHNATVYAAPYARNPFDHVSDNEIAEYRRIVERKQKGDYDTDLSESEALSGAQLTSPASARDDDEARDGMGRVLRIQTAQAPVRSQPEVVLSDDTTDFLHMERAHADRTKEQRDPNLLPDDEVFYDSPVSPAASSVTSPITEKREFTAPLTERAEVNKPVTSAVAHQEPIVVVRASVQIQKDVQPVRRPLRGTVHAATEALSANKRSVHEYSRNANFKNTVHMFDSIDSEQKHPKCKVSLNAKLTLDKVEFRNVDPKSSNATTSNLDVTYKLGKKSVAVNALDLYQAGRASSQSSLCSIPSIEWDGRCRSEYALRTRSLPRKLKNTSSTLHRTQSHSGFVNFNKDPEPTHYHLPRCNSCGATNTSYAWEIPKEERRKKSSCSLYESVGNLHQKCLDEIANVPDIVKVKENFVPVFKVAKLPDTENEFVESQEFTEDNYLGDLGNSSFSSDNKTVVEKINETVQEVTLTELKIVEVVTDEKNAANNVSTGDYNDTESAPAVYESEDINNNTMDSVEGEYHSFTEDMGFEEAVYESPVKDLFEKDIRDYSVPVDVYFKDYKKLSPEKSQQKRLETKSGLEPILEESKSSYDDSGNASNDKIDLKSEHVLESANNVVDIPVNNTNLSAERSNTSLHEETYQNLQSDSKNSEIRILSSTIETCTDSGTEIKHSKLSINLQIDAKLDKISSVSDDQYQTNNVHLDDDDECPTKNKRENLNINEAITCTIPLESTIVNELLHRVDKAIELKNEMSDCQSKSSSYLLELENIHRRESFIVTDEDSEYTTNDIEIATSVLQTAINVYTNSDDDQDLESAIVDNIYKDVYDFLSVDAISNESNQKQSIEYSVTSSIELKSFNSTAEFEKYEAVADVIANILNKIESQSNIVDVFAKLPKEKIGSHFDVEQNTSDLCLEEKYEGNQAQIIATATISTSDKLVEKPTQPEDDMNKIDTLQTSSTENQTIIEVIATDDIVIGSDQVYKTVAINSDSGHDSNDSESREQMEDFSIVKMIQDLELNINLNETILTEASETDLSSRDKIIEGILYYMLNQVFFHATDKAKANKERKLKKVITVVDLEDILLTTSPALLGEKISDSIYQEKKHSNEISSNSADLKIASLSHEVSSVIVQSEIDGKENDQTEENLPYSSELQYTKISEEGNSSVQPLKYMNQHERSINPEVEYEINEKVNANYKTNTHQNDNLIQTQEDEIQGYLEKAIDDNIVRLVPPESVHEMLDNSAIHFTDIRNLAHDIVNSNQLQAEKIAENLVHGYLEVATDKIVHLAPPHYLVERQQDLMPTNQINCEASVTENFTQKHEDNITFNAESVPIDFDKQNVVAEIEFCVNDTLNQQQGTLMTTKTEELNDSSVCEQFKEAVYLNEVAAHENFIEINEQADTTIHKDETKYFVPIKVPENASTVRSENFVEKSNTLDEISILKSEDMSEDNYHDVTYLENTTIMDNSTQYDCDNFNTASQSLEDNTEIVTALVNSIMEQSLKEYDASKIFNDEDQLSADYVLNETEEYASITASKNISAVKSEHLMDSLANTSLLYETGSLNTSHDLSRDVTYLEHTTVMDNSEHDDNDDFNTASQSVQDNTEIASDIVSSILEQSFKDYETSHSFDDEKLSSHTYVLNETEDLNNAFVETNDYYSRSSSPNKKMSLFEICTESPIRIPSNSFVGEDLSVLYEKNDTILGSPFVKQAPVIAMSQSANSGGIKYWLSFDESATDYNDKPSFKSVRKSKESNFPSFLTVDFKEEKKKQQFWNEYEKDTYRRSSILDISKSQTDNIKLTDSHQSEPCDLNVDNTKQKRRSILLAELNQSSDSNLKFEESLASCLSPGYYTCESGHSSKYESCEPKKVLLYDSRVDLHTMSTKRQYASWPPFEDTLFYKIISKFRMSESFDPKDFEDLHIDVSL